MPAVDIARLKMQAATLVEKFDQPAVFIAELHRILDFYADRTLRMGIAVPASVLPAYRASAAVLRQIENELAPLATLFPEQSMALTDALWKEGYLETRLLAAALLGRTNPSSPLLTERIAAWVQRARDPQVRRAILSISLHRIRKEQPQRFIELIQTWFQPEEIRQWSNAIYALIPLLEDPEFENLPPIYNLLSPALEKFPTNLQPELVDLLRALYAASPVETTYFLKQTIAGTGNGQLLTLLRRITNQLPPALQPALTEALRQKGRR